MGNYIIIDEIIKDGDFAINTIDKNAVPKLVSTNKYGYLGFNQSGWFSWMPIGVRHKKVIYITE